MKKWVLAILAVMLFLFVVLLFQSANPFDRSLYEVSIPKGAAAYTIQRLLEENGIIRPESSFSFAAKVLGLSRQVKAGRYEFSPANTLLTILLKLKKGEVKPPDQLTVVFPEGASIYKMGKILEKAGFTQSEKFQSLSLEGYLYPDTYFFFAQARVSDLIEKMLGRFEKVVMPFWEKAAKDTKFNLHDILTLASIIEKEAKVASERPIISSVFHNRLRAKMPLAADPTIKYALERPTKKVYHGQLEVDSLYNTYKRRGLPPGPICNPGIESIKAAVYPAKTNYYYFVAKADGSHIFSRNWTEHQKARQKAATPTQ